MKNILHKYILIKIKIYISHTPPENKNNPQKKTKIIILIHWEKFILNHKKVMEIRIKQNLIKKKNIGQKIKETAVNISKFASPLGIALILFQNRETISKELKPHWDK